MQKLIYVRHGGDPDLPDTYIEFSRDSPYILSNIPDGMGMPDVNFIATEVPGIHGVVKQGYRYEPRNIDGIEITIKGKSRADMYMKRERLHSVVAPHLNQDGYLYYYNDYGGWRIKAQPTETPKETERIKNYFKCTLSFYCSAPFWEALNEETVKLWYNGKAFKFPFIMNADNPIVFGSRVTDITIDNEGTAETPVEIIIRGQHRAEVTVTNVTTNETIIIRNMIYADETMFINTEKGNKSIIIKHDNGRVLEAFHYIKLPESVMWQLQPGKNRIKFSGDTDNDIPVEIKYRPRYLGV